MCECQLHHNRLVLQPPLYDRHIHIFYLFKQIPIVCFMYRMCFENFFMKPIFDETAILWWNVRVVIFLLYLIAHIKFSRWTVFDHLEKVLKLLILHSLSQFNLKINSTIKQLWFLKLEEQHVGITLPFKPCCPITFFNETIINRNIIIILMSS